MQKLLNLSKKITVVAKYAETLKAVTEKVDAYVAATAELKTQAQVDAAKTAKAAIDLKDIKDADKTALQTKIDAADKKVTDAEALLALAAVKTVSVKNATTVTVELETAKTGLEAKNFKVLVDGTEVTPSAVVVDATGANYTLTVATLDGKAGKVSVNGKEAAYDFTAPKVASVSAINATQVEVKFNKTVDKATAEDEVNYKVNSAAVTSGTTAVLSEDKKSVILTFPASVNKTSFDLNVKNIKTEDKEVTVAEFTGVVTVNDTVAPTVTKSEFKSNGDLEITFSEPLKVATPIVRVDGKPVSGSVLGSKVVVTASALTTAGVTVNGGQTVSVYVANVKDTVDNEAALYNGTVTKTSDSTKPSITSVSQVGQNQLKVVFSEALGASASDLGSTEFKFLNGQQFTIALVLL